ncbi:hypothetical protein [Dethiothermospora halolimnae]|uniref:hypothetical protein n=1 Tax=Dethiothermospora halolimnae TaxID=3114390 RepID=UPI003CCBF334
MEKEIHCNRCYGEINPKESFVVTTDLLKVVTYHDDCYAKELKTQNKFFLSEPLNTNIATLHVVVGNIFIIALIFFSDPPLLLGIILLIIGGIGIFYRLYSWFKYER